MIKRSIAYLVAVLLIGCATSANRLNQISIGMTKAEVVKILGYPKSTRANSSNEFLVYELGERISRPGETLYPIQYKGEYFVLIRNGVVDSYGKKGDFNSTKIPERKLDVDVRVNQ